MSDLHLDIAPDRMGGDACLAGTRLPAAQVAEHWWSGYELNALTRVSAAITPGAIKLCCWFWWQRRGLADRQGPRSRWLRANERAIWLGDWDAVEMPPQRGML